MDEGAKRRLRLALERNELTMKAASLKAKAGETFVRDVLERDRDPGVTKLAAVAKVLGTTVSEILYGSEEADTVPIVGYVGAGQAAHFYAEGQISGRAPAPDDATPSTVAVEIRGGSLGELFDRWLVYYDDVRSPVTSDLVGKLCVVGLPDGRVLVKKIQRSKSPGLYHLLSNTEGPILDAVVDWAAKVKTMAPQ